MKKPFIVWLLSLVTFFIIIAINQKTVIYTNTTSAILVFDILAGIVAFLVMGFMFLNKIRIKFGLFYLFSGSIAVILVSSILVMIFINKLNVSSYKNEPIITKASILDETKLWNLINDWEKAQGYQVYIKLPELCELASSGLSHKTLWNKNYLDSLKPNFPYNNFAVNIAKDYYSEDLILNKWISGGSTLNNLKDYYYYSCIKCDNDSCIQLFLNLPTQKNTNSKVPSNYSNNTDQEWGTVKQIGKVEYQGRFNNDATMATPNEILIAVNNYRNQNGKGSVSWDNDLAIWAQSRANLFANNGLDQHAGFEAEVETRVKNLGLKGAGEDAALGGPIAAVHLIEWMFAQDEPHKAVLLHDSNLLGVGVASGPNGYGIDLIFGRK